MLITTLDEIWLEMILYILVCCAYNLCQHSTQYLVTLKILNTDSRPEYSKAKVMRAMPCIALNFHVWSEKG